MSKKAFKSNLERINNHASRFTSNSSDNKSTKKKDCILNSVPEGYKMVPESKSKRLQILIQPSLYNKIKERAEKNRTSVNDTIHSILSKSIRGE